MQYLDIGCSNHMCGNMKTFSTLDESYRDNVKFGNNNKVSMMVKGQVIIHTKGNVTQTISNVLLISDLKTNLLSISQLQEKGYEILIKDKVYCIYDEKLGLIVQVKMTTNRMFPLYPNNIVQTCFAAQLKDLAWL